MGADILGFMREHILVLDGAMGTMLQSRGLKLGEMPEAMNLRAPELVTEIHRAYFEAGSHMVLTNTLGASRRKLKELDVQTVIRASVGAARRAAELSGAAARGDGFVALDVSSLGELLKPSGTLSFDEAYEMFREQIIAGVEAGVDAVFIETMTDLLETKCAVLAAKENSSLPVFCTMSFEPGGHTFLGTNAEAAMLTLDALGVDALGANCSVGPSELLPLIEVWLKRTSKPLVVKPNAGMPCVCEGKTVFNVSADGFARDMKAVLEMGAAAVGGCCGTTPEYIERLAELTRGRKPATRRIDRTPVVCSSRTVIDLDRVRVVGERVNPTGKKRFQQALREGDMDYILRQALEQEAAGADILDVNVGLPGIDEKRVMEETVLSVQSAVSLPLQIDSSDARALEAGLRVYSGKPIINSVNGEEAVLETVLPLVKKYGAMVIGLTLDREIPRTAEERLLIAEKIVRAAESHGIDRRDVIIDCLTLTAGAEQAVAYETLKALRLVKERLGVKTALGVSNISFGLPGRAVLNRVFLTLALGEGLDLPIINPNDSDMMDAVCCYHQLRNIDAGSGAYLERFGGGTEKTAAPTGTMDLAECVERGLKDVGAQAARELLLASEAPMEIIDKKIVPALDRVGRRYEAGELFLPQLLRSAEAAQNAFAVLREAMPAGADRREEILLATVQGDIHDIGKNIVKVVLETYGYHVRDLGRDVPPEAIAEQAEGVRLVGLSALMTTTVDSMEKTIALLKTRYPEIVVMVGGAVLTEDYAARIGADRYARDAMGAVAIAAEVFALHAPAP